MTPKNRYIELSEDIKNHLFTWATDDDWKKLPAPLNTALTTVMNELKVYEAMKNSGFQDERVEGNEKEEKKQFIAIFKQKYLEFTDFNYKEAISPITQVIISKTIDALRNDGASSLEFLEWFFDEFATQERNKQFMPPTINFVTSSFVVSKFLYQMKDTLKMRKKDIDNMGVRNLLLGIAVPFLERCKDKSLSEKLFDFSRNKINPRKFIVLLKAYAEKFNDEDTINKLAEISEK